MTITFAIRSEERDDVRAMAIVKASLVRYGYRIKRAARVACHRNGGLWQYTIPVVEWVEA